MSWPAIPAVGFAASAQSHFKSTTWTAVLVCAAYLLGATLAFLCGPLSDKIFSPFWSPNIVLLAAFLLLPREHTWVVIAAAFPVHLTVETVIGTSLPQQLLAFAMNVAIAAAGTMSIRLFLGEPPWLGTIRKATTYVLVLGFAWPLVVAVGAALMRMSAESAGDHYLSFWLPWFAANALANLTLGPVALIFMGEGAEAFSLPAGAKRAEAIGLLFALIASLELALHASDGGSAESFVVALLYAPVPIIVWSAVRFGTAGASVSVLIVTAVVIGHALNGSSSLVSGMLKSNAVALQLFLVFLSAPVLLLGASTDQARRAEDKLREDEERIAFAGAAANVAFWRLGSAREGVWVSDHGRDLLGLPPRGELTRDAILAVIHPDDVRLVDDVFTAGENEQAGRSVEFRVALHHGRQRWILCHSRSHPRTGDTCLETSGVFIDITARKTAETQHRELAHLMRVSQVGELSSGLAHELTQPLTAILANAQAAKLMLASKPSDLSAVAEVIDDIILDDKRASEVIKRLRALLKKSDAVSDVIDVNGLCESTVTLLRAEAVTRGVHIALILGPRLPKVIGDSVQLQQVLLNLLMNAIEAAQSVPSTRRSVVVRTQGLGSSGVEVSVEDQGPGISAMDRGRLFEPFFTTKEMGLGMGLSICSAIVRRHGGTLGLENNAFGGATAYMRLPLQSRGRSTL